ncbi:MAG: peptide chain release factor N(5)-glutamine methyltransferase [Treponema sp.]|nr:peptide chain release factor N(5)-glutamine methyltransferase [Treponema sp.]
MTDGIRLLKSPRSSARGRFGSAFIDTPVLDATLLLAETLRTSRENLVLNENEPISPEDRETYTNLLERRRSGECIAYILGRKEFRDLEFSVNPNVLVPRPETEILLEATLEEADSLPEELGISILDLCTGSGALAISLKNERSNITLTASDISGEALETASHNAGRLLSRNLTGDDVVKPDSVNFIQSDLFESIHDRFNIIMSNPPYVSSGELSTLTPEIQREPRLALDGGTDGLELIRRIISGAYDHLLPGGILLLEADPGQMAAISGLLETHSFHGIKLHKDLSGRERVISAKHL